MTNPNKDCVKAMEEEFDVIERNQAWKLVKLPPNRKLTILRRVYKLKKNSVGKMLK